MKIKKLHDHHPGYTDMRDELKGKWNMELIILFVLVILCAIGCATLLTVKDLSVELKGVIVLIIFGTVFYVIRMVANEKGGMR